MADQLTAEEIKQRIRDEFQHAAPTYDTQRTMRACVTPLVEAAAFRPGQRVLDIAAGTGFIAIPAAKAVAPGGSVVALDLSPDMLERLRQNAAAAGVSNIESRFGDAEALDLPDAAFDVVTCGLGIFFLPNQKAALLEWFRVLKPGGWLHFSAWGAGLNEPGISLFRSRLDAYGLAGQRPSLNQLPRPEQCSAVLEEAGFVHTKVTQLQVGFHHPDFEDYWAEISTLPLAVALTKLESARLAKFKEEHRAEVEGVATPQGIWRNAPVNIASGRKP